MKPACILIGLSMLLSLGACAAPYAEDAEGGPREEVVKSAERAAEGDALDALRSRVQEDFASAPSLRGHEIVVVASRITGTPDEIAIQARIMKRTGEGKELDLDEADFAGIDGKIDVTSPYRSRVTAIVVKDEGGTWSTLKTGLLGSRAVEAYVVGQSPDAFEGWAQDFALRRSRTARAGL